MKRAKRRAIEGGEAFRVEPGTAVRLSRHDPAFTGRDGDKEAALAEVEVHAKRLRELQFELYAENRRSLLIILQGLDAAGKDGTINHVFQALDAQGARVQSFKVPSAEEQSHDFLWRVHQRVPAVGEIVIFNRSHYEDVLVARVHKLPKLTGKRVWTRRYDRIREFEKNLVDAGTRIVKFFLHMSPQEQLQRFEQRLADPSRHWKISESDYTERELWPRYVDAYEDALSNTSTKHAPWYIVPSDRKWFRNLVVSRVVVAALESMKIRMPAPRVDIEAMRRKYHAAVRRERRGE